MELIIMPVDYKEYHPKWPLIVRLIRKRAGNCCEGSEKYPDCRAENYKSHPVTGSFVILTCGHVDGDIENNRFSNLKYWCQRCHFGHDRGDNIMRRKYGRKYSRKHQLKLFIITQPKILTDANNN
jgi:hypothetical protein